MRFPENIQVYMQDSFSKARDSYEKATVYTKGNMQALEEAVVATQTNAKKLGEKVLRNVRPIRRPLRRPTHSLAQNAGRACSPAVGLPSAANVGSKRTAELFELSTEDHPADVRRP